MQLKESDKSRFDHIYKDMTVQFPQSELKNYDCQKRLFTDKKSDYHIYTAFDGKKETGYIIFYADKENKVLWLDYIAVFREFHSQGYGSKILEAIKKTFKEMNGMFLEVEKPDENEPNTIRRIKFYTKHGAKKSDCSYFYPNRSGFLEMDLYFLPFKEGFSPTKEMTRQAVKNVFQTIHCDLPHVNEVLDKIII